MTTTKTRKAAEPTTPPTFADIARKRIREQLTAYRGFVERAVAGEQLEESELSQVADLLEGLGLPDFAWSRDVEAASRFAVSSGKLQAAVDAEPTNRQRTQELAKEVGVLQAKLRTLHEELRRAQSGAGKVAAYGQTLSQLQHDHPQALADIDTAVTVRLEELNRRKAGGAS
jgi:phosphoglycerate-specific signal transduction histidine kinase